MPGRSRSATEERALECSGAMAAGSGTQSRGGSLDGHYVAPARSVTAKVPGIYSTEAPPPKSLEVEPGNEASQDDVSLNDIWIM